MGGCREGQEHEENLYPTAACFILAIISSYCCCCFPTSEVPGILRRCQPGIPNYPHPSHLTVVTTIAFQEWRGEHYAATRAEYLHIKAQLAVETFPPVPGATNKFGGPNDSPPPLRTWAELSTDEQHKMLQERLKKYCQKVHMCVGGFNWVVGTNGVTA